MSKNFIDGLLSDTVFRGVVAGSDIQFSKEERSCIMSKFLKSVSEDDDMSSRGAEFKYALDSDLECFLESGKAVDLLKQADSKLTEDNCLKQLLIYYKFKIYETIILRALNADLESEKLIKALKVFETNKTLEEYREVLKVANITQTDALKEAFYSEVRILSYDTALNSVRLENVYYTYIFNLYLKLFLNWELIVHSQYNTQKNMNKDCLLIMKDIQSTTDKHYSTKQDDIKKILKKVGSKFTGLEERLSTMKGRPLFLTGDEDLDKLILKDSNSDNYETNTSGKEEKVTPYILKDKLLTDVSEDVKSSSGIPTNEDGSIILKEVPNSTTLVKDITSFKDSTDLLANAKISENKVDPTETQKSIDGINSINQSIGQLPDNPQKNSDGFNSASSQVPTGNNSFSQTDSVLTSSTTNELRNQTLGIKQLSKSSKESGVDMGTNLAYGSDKPSSSKALLGNVQSVNQGYQSTLDDMGSSLSSNQQQVTASIGALLGLQTTLMDKASAYNDKVSIIQEQLDIISEVVNDLKQTACILSSLICFVKTLKQRLALTLEEFKRSGTDTLENIKQQKDKLIGMWEDFESQMNGYMDKELRKLVRQIVQPKVLPLALLVDEARYVQVRAALDQAIVDTVDNLSAKDALYSELVDGFKTSSQSITESLRKQVEEATDTSRCKVKPLFEVPQLLSFNIEGLIFRNSMLDSLDFSLMNCKD